MNRLQRLVLFAAMVLVLWQVVEVATPMSAVCGAPATAAFEDAGGGDELDSPAERLRGAWAESRSCRPPARRQLWRSGVIVGVVVLGTAGGLRLLRDPGSEVDAAG